VRTTIQEVVSVLLAQHDIELTLTNEEGHSALTLAATLQRSAHPLGDWLNAVVVKLQEKRYLTALLHRGISTWSNDDVVRWLMFLGYSEYVAAFRATHVDGPLLIKLCRLNLNQNHHNNSDNNDNDNADDNADPLKTELHMLSLDHRIDIRKRVRMLLQEQNTATSLKQFSSSSLISTSSWNREKVDTPISIATHNNNNNTLQRAVVEETPVDTQWYIDYTDLEVGEVIGKGYFGEVRRGTWKGIPVALKYIYRDLQSVKEKNMFFKEISILSKLRHPNVITLLGWSRIASLTATSPRTASLSSMSTTTTSTTTTTTSSTSSSFISHDPTTIVMVLEYMSGGTLYHALRYSYSTLTTNSALRFRILLDIVKGMTYLHSRGVLHRDLNTKNLLLTEHWTCKISDFGLSRFWGPAGDAQHMTTHVGFLVTMAPEVFKGEPYTEKADVYSFAMVMYELFTGQTPNVGDVADPLKFAHRAAHEQYRPPLTTDIPSPVRSLITRCWAHDPSERPTFQTILHELMSISSSDHNTAADIAKETEEHEQTNEDNYVIE
jgi:hypothetical protein